MSTAGLSRAYAVLRQLDVLRAESITNPLPMSGDRRSRARRKERGGSDVGRSLFPSREELAVRGVRLQGYRTPPPSDRRGWCAGHGGVIWEDSIDVGATQGPPSRLAGATDHRGYSSKHPHAYTPARSHLIPASPTHDGPQVESSRPAAAERDCHAAAATTSADVQSRRSPLSSEYALGDRYDHHAPPPPPPSCGSGASPLLLSSSNSPVSHHRYNTQIAREQPLRRSPSARVAVPSPVVLPSSFTSEAAHVAAAQTSSLLEVYFDKDDMHAVLDSVAAATAAAATSPAQPVTVAAGAADTACCTHTRTARGTHRGYGAAADFMHSLGASVDASATTEAAATPSSLSNSSLTAMAGGDAQSASGTSLVTAADDGRHPLWQLSMSRHDVGDKQHGCRSAAAASAASLPTRVKDVSITPSVERLLGARHQRSRSVGQQHQQLQREAAAPATAASLRPLFSPPPSGDLSSFYTAAGRSVRAEGGGNAYAAEAPQHQQEEACISLSRHSRLPLHGIPSPRGAVDAEPSSPRVLADGRSEGVGDDGSGGADESEGSSPLGLHGLSAGRADEGSIDQDAYRREGESLRRRALLGAAEEKSVQRAAVDDDHQRRDTHRPSQNDSRGQGVACGERRRVMPLFPAAYTKAVPFLDYLARVNAAGSHQLLKELAAMGDAWATTTPAEDAAGGGGEHPELTEQVVVDCLAMDLLLNKSDALGCIVVPWLRARLESMMATHSADRMNSSARKHRDRGKAVAANTLRRTGESEAEGLGEGDAAANNSVLCAIIGLGPVAFTLLPTLLQLLIGLPPPSPTSMCDVRLVGLAIRTAGGADGLEAVIRIVQQQAEGPHVLAAAAYALGTYSFELVGHTSVLCVPAGAMRRPDAKGGADLLFQLVPDDLSATTADLLSASPMMEELRPLFGRDSLLFSPTATTAAPTGRHLLYLQSPPPYQPTHVLVDAELARCELLAYLRSDQFRVTDAHPYVMALLNDALSARLLSAVVTPAAQSLYSATMSRLRRDLHRVLAEGVGSTAPHQRDNDDGSDVDETGAAAHALLRLPLLPYSLDRFFAEEKDLLFALESALVHALLARFATPLVQEQALMSLSTLPPVARVHVVQPVVDFFMRSARTLQLRQATTMRRSVAQAGRTDPPATSRAPRNGAREVDADDNVTVAAAIAAGTVCVNPLAPSSCVDSCVASLVPVFQELLHSPLWRVRHAACVGLARVGPLTADPSSIVDFLLTCLVLHAPSVTEESTSNQAPSAAATRSPELPLQSSTVVWCLAQQRQGGARALLQLLQDPQQPSQVHHWCAFQLAEVDVREACANLNRGESPEADALLDEMVQVLGRLIATQGALEEDALLLCVRALAEVVHRHYVNATSPASTAAAMNAVLFLDTAEPSQEAATLCQEEEEEPNACYIVLTSVLESALLPTNVLKALCLYLCRYGGGHGELYACKALLQSSSVAVRTAAAFGLRACGAKVLRSVVLGMNDDSFDVRRESFETLTVIGAAAALEVLHRRPVEHRYQVQTALRDCLLQDASRPVPRKVAETLYRALVSEEPLVAQELS
ncbi:conserved hypothetical protein [Leishmania major strain Friedlin]|uniref:Uncharacterized protein n=1 Tax=Leishmania major TaxID=5664 RepID=Q4Q809_LEIMA|nr:conserved hypothetical protein [Leishmania major strain Friedlin]CAG9577369.1 hypothetical_protein_-_conserved [Leishmania major strain Friedlin]CAJ05711.1 conserved hypothetical protein [Leishmania major strain Friedlin]|eukprot:XP_001684539.1 conserved hypothetical protein [Leishmania major strain Friedlin]